MAGYFEIEWLSRKSDCSFIHVPFAHEQPLLMANLISQWESWWLASVACSKDICHLLVTTCTLGPHWCISIFLSHAHLYLYSMYEVATHANFFPVCIREIILSPHPMSYGNTPFHQVSQASFRCSLRESLLLLHPLTPYIERLEILQWSFRV